MRVQTRSVTISATPQTVFDYVSQAENLPQWAPEFAHAVRRENDHWVATNASGEVHFTFGLGAEFGVVDFLGLVAADAYVLRAPTRVVALGPNQAEYLFTLFRLPGEPDEAFARRLAVVSEELETLREILEGAVVR